MLHIDFVCTGNICRSPMAEVIVRDKLAEAGFGEDAVQVTSSGIGNWHVGHQADHRALAELAAHGYNGEAHRAQQFGAEQFDADLIVALDHNHVSELVARGVPEDKVRLLRSFDPQADADDLGVADPYYGGPEGFAVTREQIEAAADGIIAWVRAALR
ncbi:MULTISPECIES: low molecular weight protein-tyrosine-phosphatase [Corynebacterium]|uniref:low molecular weight protein-tyrosine-phosphatase n=1 Tax=Corynebacterium TaxID=1716 RepID=UPI0008A2E130|nr:MULTISPECIES: low molecular weight protein-tyrosine-phosphatase [Corynebacterium]MDK7181210.1 low molecular weight protein-tyrosine-phosphatase [Corynebacterium riegelii]OFT73940.1 protein tyrosine phosphatase [Corynebacterium sp. HMSC30G07]PLA13201.1 low molecular weight phosphotyrosine protein phosphatase [Corynebacterium riegelii]